MSFDYKQTHFEVENQNDEKRRWRFFGATRIVILIIGLICITCTNANMILMNFTVICMDDVIVEQTIKNQTHWLERSYDISLTFSSCAIGAIFGTIPAVALITRFGIRKILTIYGLLSAIATLLMPLAVNHGLYFVLLVRLFQGLGASILYSSIGTISENWSPISQIGTFVAFLSSAFQISNILTMPISGILCESSLGWRYIYYLFGSITVFMYIVFFLFYRDHPENHKNVGSAEFQKIQKGKINLNKKKHIQIKEIFTDINVLQITLAIIGGSSAVICLNNYGPIYLNKVLGLNIRETGYSNAIPYLLAAIVKFAAGPLTDKLAHISERFRLILFVLFPQITMAIGFLVMSFTFHVTIAQIAYTISVVLAGLNVVGMVKSAQIVAKEHIDLIMAIISMSSWISAFVLPIVIGILCPDNTHEQWSTFYLGVAIFVFLTNLPFPFLAKTQYTRKVGAECNSEL